ncbi:MAG TPA: CBS domain-containing protein [Acidimicrobiia bacterium]|nr:CBS domain-containing protein [Acidimicrobiia bacterium]
MQIRNLMTTDVATIEKAASLKDAARILIERNISGLPVVDEQGELVGIVTEGDVLHQESLRHPATTIKSFFQASEDRALTVEQAMTRKVKTIRDEADHTEAARLMESTGVKRLPVTNSDGRLVGILSRSDILKIFARADADISQEIRSEVIERILWLEPARLTVDVAEGVVTLEGTVPTKSDSRILEEMARRIDGVVNVSAERLRYELDDTKRTDRPITGDAPKVNW